VFIVLFLDRISDLDNGIHGGAVELSARWRPVISGRDGKTIAEALREDRKALTSIESLFIGSGVVEARCKIVGVVLRTALHSNRFDDLWLARGQCRTKCS